MTEPTGDPVQPGTEQETPPVQPPPEPPATNTPASPPEGYVEQARFSGAIRKIEELTTENRSLKSQLDAKSSEVEQLNAQLANKDIEKTVAVGERDKILEQHVTENTALKSELDELRAYKLKVETAKKIGHPELVNIMHSIPSMSDEEALEAVMKDFVSFTDQRVQEREQQLLAGSTPAAPPLPPPPSSPTTNQGWQDHINRLPLGSPERAKAFDDWYEWQVANPNVS